MKTNKIVYWIATGLLSAMALMSAGMYFFNNAEITLIFMMIILRTITGSVLVFHHWSFMIFLGTIIYLYSNHKKSEKSDLISV